MSETIDSRVVEMRFDNKNFVNNVHETMSTLDKLKQKLNLTGASKGIENLDSAAKKVNMNGLGNAVETVHAKFSALEVMGVTALANITNSAVNAGKKIVSALTIDPIKTGFQEYETQINAVQTILANTSHNGTTIDEVNNALDTLNAYADKTIYNFTEMTRNIGTFTAAGVDLQTSVDSIQGIANLAAVSGSTSQQASTAMYQLSQALAAGKVSLMDWNSVVNAGMGGKVFQDALIRTSELLKTGAKDAIATHGSFRESLTKGEWLTTEVLTETLKQFAGAYSEAELMAQGFTQEQAKEIAAMAKTAEEAATKVKTWTQLWDVIKESAQSGWTQTWELIFGDFEEAKALLTPLADFLIGVINKISETRNALLEGTLGKSFTGLIDKISSTTAGVEGAVDTLKDYGEVVDKILNGDFGNGQSRWDKLTEAGYDWAHAQNLVNEKLGDGTRHATDYKEAQDDLKKSENKVTQARKLSIDQLAAMSDEELKNIGYKEDQIEALRELERQAEKTGIPLKKFVKDIDQINGRYLLINGFKNIGQSLVKVFTAMGKAWKSVFPPATSDQLYNVIAGFHKFTTYLEINTAKAVQLKQTFRGVFAALDIVLTLVGGPLKIAFKVLTTILSYFNMDILDVTAAIGRAIYKFRNWLDSVFDVSGALDIIIPLVKSGIEAIKGWIDEFKNLPQVQKIINGVKEAFTSLKDIDLKSVGKSVIDTVNGWIDALGKIPQVQKLIDNIKSSFNNLKDIDFKSIGQYIVEGFANGIGEGARRVIESVIELANHVITTVCEIFDINSPSKVFFAIGGFIITGLILGLQNGFGDVLGWFEGLGTKIIEFVGNIDWGTVFAGGVAIGMLATIKKLADGFASLTAPLEGLGNIFDSTSELIQKSSKSINKILKGFGKVLNSFAFSIKAKALKDIAIALGILAASVFALSFIEPAKLWNAVGVVAALAVIMVVLSLAVEKMSKASVSIGKDGAAIDNLRPALVSMAAALLVMAVTAKMLGSMSLPQMIQGFVGLGVLIGAIAAVFLAYGKLVKGDSGENIDKAGKMILKLSVAMLLLVGVVKLVGKLSTDEMIKGGIFAVAFVVFVGLLTAATKSAGKDVDKIGGMILKLSLSMLLLVGVVKLVGKLSSDEMWKGAIFAVAFVVFVKMLVKVTQTGNDKQIAKLGGLLLSISLSMLLMVGLCKLVGKLTPGEMIKGAAFVVAFMIMVKMLVKITTIGNDQQIAKVAGTILAMSVAVAILAGVAILLSLINVKGLIKGIAAVGCLSVFMALMIKTTKDAQDCKSNLIVMAVAIGVMAAAVAALSFIEPTKLAGATIAMAVLMGMFASLIKSTANVTKSMGTLIVMTVAIGLLGGLIYLLAQLPVESTLGSAAALSLLLVVVSGSLIALSKMVTSISSALKGVLALTAMALPLLAFVGVLTLMQNVQNATANTKTLISLVTALTLLLIPLTIIGYLWVGAAAGIIALTAMVIPMLAFVGVLALMEGISNATANVEALMTLMNSMTNMLVKLAIVGPLALIGVGAMAALTGLMVAIGALAVGIGYLVQKFPALEEFISTGIPILEQIAFGIGSFIGNLINGFATGVADALPVIGAQLSLFMLNLTPFIVGVKMVDASLLEGVGILAASILLLTAADLIAGLMTLGGLSLVELGMSLSNFIVAAMPFISTIQTIKPESVEAAKTLAEMILVLTAADIISGIATFLGGSADFSSFGTQLVAFGKAVCDFSNTLSENGGINEEAVTSAANAGKVMAELQKSLYGAGGLKQDIFGEKDLSVFGTQLVAFGKAVCDFSNTLTSNGGIDNEAVESAANAGSVMAELQNSLYGAGGLKQDIFGDKDLSVFGTQLVAFGNAICDFSNVLTENGGVNSDAIESAANAGQVMAALQGEIESAGGLKADIFGENNLETFGAQIKAFGQAMVDFSEIATGNISEDAVTAAANAGSVMAEVQAAIPEDKWLDGKISIDDFGKKIAAFGEGLVEYSNKVVEIDGTAVSTSISAARRLVSLAQSLVDLDTSGIDSFKNVKSIGSSMSTYYDKVSGMDTSVVSSSITSAQRLVLFINSLASLDSSGIGSFESAISSLAKVNFSGLEKAFSGATAKLTSIGTNMMDGLVKGMKSRQTHLITITAAMINAMLNSIKSKMNLFMTMGTTIMTRFIAGITKQSSKVKSAFTTVVSGSVTSIRKYYEDFYDAGSYLVTGFTNGIDDNMYKAEAKAAAMAEAAKEAAEEALGIQSPSKVFYGIGDYTGQGFINALADYATKAYAAGSNMADSARSGLSDAIAKAKTMIDDNVEAQPAIRPVLDLSGVKSGASAISNLFGKNSTVGVLANVGAINSAMNSRSQNGGNGEVVSAINKLRKDLGKVGGTTYQINGVTYDDGSNISDAVKSIVRAARVERRI